MPVGTRLSLFLIFAAMALLLIGVYYFLGVSLKNYFISVGEHFRAFFRQSLTFFKGLL